VRGEHFGPGSRIWLRTRGKEGSESRPHSSGSTTRSGLDRVAPSLDHVGFLTFDVAGAAALASILVEDNHVDHASHFRRPMLGIPEGPYLSARVRGRSGPLPCHLRPAGCALRGAAGAGDAGLQPDRGAASPPDGGRGGTGDPVMNLPWTHAGFPALGVPAGHNADGLPMVLQLTARWKADEDLLHFGHEIARIVAPPAS